MIHLIALIDGSVYSQSVCDHAAWMAKQTDASVDLIHVLGRRSLGSTPADLSGNLKLGARSALLAELAELDAQSTKLELRRGRIILDEAEQRLKVAGIYNVTSKLRHSDFVGTVQEFDGGADAIIIGKRGEAADFAKLHLGSNLERVVRAATKPVLVASRAFRPIKSFMIAYDGGASAEKAVQHIVKGKLFADLHCSIVTFGKANAASEARLEQAASLLRDAGYDVDSSFIDGEPERAIKQKIEENNIDLLVMGAYGHSRMRQLIIGSTTTEMVRSCLVPVMMFR